MTKNKLPPAITDKFLLLLEGYLYIYIYYQNVIHKKINSKFNTLHSSEMILPKPVIWGQKSGKLL